MAFRTQRHNGSSRWSSRQIESLERRELMAADFMAPLPPPDAIPADIQLPRLEKVSEIHVDPGIFDDLGSLLPANDPFVGTWTNVDPGTGGITKIQITRDQSGHHIEAWGACVPDDCQWGKVDLDLLGTSVQDTTPDYALGNWDPGFKDATIALQVVEDGLVADLYNVFKDDSGRADYHQRYRLTDSGDLIQQYVLGDERFGDVIVGGWVSENPNTSGITSLNVAASDEGLTSHAWGACVPNDCDWSAVPMHTLGTSIGDATPERSAANWDHGFSTVFMTTHLSGGDLVVEKYTVFHDDSGRSNYYSQENMWKLGDSNHDGAFDTSDLVLAFQSGEYEDGIAGNSAWEEGDWNRDGDFDSNDIIEAMQSGGYEAAPILNLPAIQLPKLAPVPDFDPPIGGLSELLPAIDHVLAHDDFDVRLMRN